MILRDKNAVITGCLQGIGKSTLEVFANNGANVWACAMSYNEDFENFCKGLALKNNVWIKPLYFDLLKEDEIKLAVKEIISSKLPVHTLVNIAGMTKDSLFHMIPMEQMKMIFEVNFFSQIYLSQYISKLMLRNGEGSIINISSISAIDGSHGQLSYSSSKAALIGATKTLSKELASKGIRVNAIAPGVIETDILKSVPENVIADRLSNIKLKRLGGAEEVANTILFLASDLSSHITGQIIRIDGGMK